MTWWKANEGKVWVGGDIQIRRQYLRLVSQFIAQLRPQFSPTIISLFSHHYPNSSPLICHLLYKQYMSNVFHASWGKFDGRATEPIMFILFSFHRHRISFDPPSLPFQSFYAPPFSCWMEAAASLTLISPLSSTFAEQHCPLSTSAALEHFTKRNLIFFALCFLSVVSTVKRASVWYVFFLLEWFFTIFLCFVGFAKLSVWVGGWRKCNSSEAIYFAIHQLLKATQSIESIYFTHPPFRPLNLRRVAANFFIYFINNIFKTIYEGPKKVAMYQSEQ